MVAYAPYLVGTLISFLAVSGETTSGTRPVEVTGQQLVAAHALPQTESKATSADQSVSRADRIAASLTRFFNVSTTGELAWVAFGLFGQVLFAGRMIVQWLVSEYHKRVHVPTSFWWMSVFGASILLTYFCWRRDPVGILGQSLGWMIYVRNLWMIYVPRHDRLGHEPAASTAVPVEAGPATKAA